MLAQRPSKRQPATHSLPHLCQDPHMGQEKASSRPLAHVVPHVDPAWARSSQASQAGIGLEATLIHPDCPDLPVPTKL